MNVRGALEYRAACQRILAIVCVFALLFNNVLLIASAEEQPWRKNLRSIVLWVRSSRICIHLTASIRMITLSAVM